MRQLASASLLAALSIASAACTTAPEGEPRPDDVEDGWRSGGKGDGETCDFESMTTTTFLEQFAYRERVNSLSGSKYYTIGSTWDVRATLANGDQADLDVYLLPDNRVIVEYAELHALGGSSFDNLNRTVVVTRAHADDATHTITIDGIGTGTPLKLTRDGGGCKPAMTFTHKSDLRTPGLAGHGAIIEHVWTSGYVIDPDHLDQVPSEAAREYFEEDVASGKIKVIHI